LKAALLLRLLLSTTFILIVSLGRSMAALADVQKYALERIRPSNLPKWADTKFRNEPVHGRIPLANLPTPLYRIHSNGHEDSLVQQLAQKYISFYIKRDDMSGGVELGGNKVYES